MVVNTNLCDPLNELALRNIRNTKKRSYNCAGYALGTFSWYCPDNRKHRLDDYSAFYGFHSISEGEDKTILCVDQLLADFPSMRVINSLDELTPDEYAILFRLSKDGDFHFLKRGKNGVWYEKRGSMRQCLPFKGDIWSEWNNRYDGPIVIFAKKFAKTP